jgi:glutamate-ammonia-ligase adenylyltransferase
VVPSPSDLFLSPDLSEEDARGYLRALGFRDPEATDRHLQAMSEDMAIREAMGRIAGDLLPALLESPDPDAAVVGLSHYLAARTGRGMFLDYLAEDPRAMHVLACVFGSSPMLSEILVRHPEYFHWLVSQVERSAPERQDLEEELAAMLANIDAPDEALSVLKRWQRRELLRIATRDLLRRETVPAATAQLSDLAEVAVDGALSILTPHLLREESRAAVPGTVAVIGLGALGGRELSYAPDLELLFVHETTDDPKAGAFFERLRDSLTEALDGHEEHEAMYRVTAGAADGGALDDHFRALAASDDHADRLALIRARPVAGDAALGARFVDAARAFMFGAGAAPGAIGSLWRDARGAEFSGARQVERLTQLFQLAHGATHPALTPSGTLAALDMLAARGLVPETAKRELSQAYVFLRTVEHRLQLVHDRQTGLGSSEDLEKQVAAYRSRVADLSAALIQPLTAGR